jgi:hypothetical protein
MCFYHHSWTISTWVNCRQQFLLPTII